MFGKVGMMLKLSEAGGYVKRALDLPLSPLPYDPADLAPKLIARTYGANPAFFDGGAGKKAHALAVAAIALAEGLSNPAWASSRSMNQCVFLALGRIIQDAEHPESPYRLTQLDRQLLQVAQTAYLDHEAKTRDATSAVVGSLGL